VIFPLDNPKSFACKGLGLAGRARPVVSPYVPTAYNNSKKLSENSAEPLDKWTIYCIMGV
jgi:hypothetical protein